jgi:hypothetical protein
LHLPLRHPLDLVELLFPEPLIDASDRSAIVLQDGNSRQ